jgi:hypothetical protein
MVWQEDAKSNLDSLIRNAPNVCIPSNFISLHKRFTNAIDIIDCKRSQV